MQQLALWGNFRSANDKGGWAVGTWTLVCHASQLGYGSLALSPAIPLTRWGPASRRLHTPEPWVCAGLFSPKWWGHRDWLCCQSCLDPHPSPARTGFSASGLTQVAASTPYPDVLAPGPPALCRCHWCLGGDVSSLLAGETKVCIRLIPAAGIEVLRRLSNPFGFQTSTWRDLSL